MRRFQLLRSLVLLLALLALAPRAHAAAGLLLRWNACFGDGGVANRAFACNTNSGSQTLVGGFQLSSDMPVVTGNEITLNLAAAGPTLPAWWQMRNPGLCRETGALSINFVNSPTATQCVDWAQDAAVGGIGAYNIGPLGPNT